MKARVKSSGEIVEVEKTVCYCATWSDHERIYNESDLDFNLDNQQPEATISGWVARTQEGALGLFRLKPERTYGDWWIDVPTDDPAAYLLPPELFPSLTWESDPIEVEITIKPKKQ